VSADAVDAAANVTMAAASAASRQGERIMQVLSPNGWGRGWGKDQALIPRRPGWQPTHVFAQTSGSYGRMGGV
jgi:hypothetical protein